MKEKPDDIFERLKNGETIPADDPEIHKLRDESYAGKEVLVRMNLSSDPSEIRTLLGMLTGSSIDESTAVFTPFTLIMESPSRLVRMCLSISTASF